MSAITTTGSDISALMQFKKSQLASRLENINALDHKLADVFEVISDALQKYEGGDQNAGISLGGPDQNKLTFNVDIQADAINQRPAVKGSLLMDVKNFESNRLTLNSIKFIGANAENDLAFELKGSLSLSSSTELAGQITEVSASTLDRSKLLVVTGPRELIISSDAPTNIKGIKYTEAGITTEITGKLNIDADNNLQGLITSLRIHDSNDHQNSVQWSGSIDYASLQEKSGSLTEIKDLFSSEAMAPLFAGEDFFKIQRTDTLSQSGAALQTVWYGFDGDDFMTGGDGRESFYGGSDDDSLFGNGGDDLLVGDRGNDTLYGGHGDDQLLGDSGNDILRGDWGNDLMKGGDGADTYVDLIGNNIIEDIAGSSDIKTGDGNDVINTGTSTDYIKAGDGNNVIKSGAGNDDISAGNGNDQIWSGAGYDTIRAGGGDDTIDSGAGKDQVFGGAGADRFMLNQKSSTSVVTIADFNASEGDRLVLNQSVFDKLSAGLLGRQFIASASGTATTPDQRLIFDTRDGKLYYDPDGLGGQSLDLIATLVGVNALSVASINLQA